MSLPLSINLAIAGHLLRSRLGGRRGPLPLVLMAELTHACNLACAGCGRVREYAEGAAARLTGEQFRQAMLAADTPVVSISGGEPLLHPDSPAMAAEALERGKVVYFCTNGLLLAKRLGEFRPHKRFYFNVHLDGPPEVHDALAGRPGTAEAALAGIAQAKAAGFGVTSNTTVYRGTSAESLVALFDRLTGMGVDGLMVAPAFAYEVGTDAATMTREQARQRFRELDSLWGERNLYHTPLYMQFLRGERELACTPWGTVTYNPRGWKRPCYLLTDGHAASFEELMRDTDWARLGPGKEPRCANCLLHSGFEPSVMNSLRGPRDWWRVLRWQLGR